MYKKNEDNLGTAVILAGGDSKRFGSPKALLKLGEKPIIEHIASRLKECFGEIIIVTNQPELFRHMKIRLIEDVIKSCKKSSLRGLHAGLYYSSHKSNFIIACDMPFVNLDLIKYMHAYTENYHIVVPCVDNYLQPLYAFYSKECTDTIEAYLRSGKFKIADLYKEFDVKYIPKEIIFNFDPEEKVFFNINTHHDFTKLQENIKHENILEN